MRNDEIYPSQKFQTHHKFKKADQSANKNDSDSSSTSRTTSAADGDYHDAKSSKKKSQDDENKCIVYIPDIPFNIRDLKKLEKTVCQLITKNTSSQGAQVQCFPEFGFGVIHVVDNKIKQQLVEHVQQIKLTIEDNEITIPFSNTLEVVSFVVLDKSNQRTSSRFPTPEDISRKCTTYLNVEEPLSCAVLDAQFPNIYRLIYKFSDQFINSETRKQFFIDHVSTEIYLFADCSFLEDLSVSITERDLETAIKRSIQPKSESSANLYAQIDQCTHSACVIVTGEARKWTAQSCIDIDGRQILRRSFNYHLLIDPVSKSDVDRIIKHQVFKGKVIDHKYADKKLLVIVKDKYVFGKCLRLKKLEIDGQSFRISENVESQEMDDCEINAQTWYKTKMIKVKSDIMQFLDDPHHFIFKCRWNAKAWLEEFENSASTPHHDASRSDKSSKPDQTRHLLRMTVMLDTFAAVKKKRYFIDDQEVKLNLDDRLTTIIYNHQSKLEQCSQIPYKKIQHDRTNIQVQQEDCLVVYEKLVEKGYRPVLLNMANQTTPGGGYKKGDGAQEENIFRRSDYFRSLDLELDSYHDQRAERFIRTSDCEKEPVGDEKRIYPMDEFGAIYTSGLTVFRHSEDKGYAYMKKPLTGVRAIAIAAYRVPELDDNQLAPEAAVGMRKKIETIFSIAHRHGHDSLVLSAFGCGAFKNPPEHVAQLFLSVIEQYAGFFKLVVFAIIDDHNTGGQLNREGNFKPFEKLDGKSVKRTKLAGIPNTIIGPYRLLSDGLTVSDVCIFDSPPCKFAAMCNDRNPDHLRSFSHPPLCALAFDNNQCDKSSDRVHMHSFIHPRQCSDGGECALIDNKKHCQEFEHPSYCRKKSDCNNMDPVHLREYRHLPLCPEAHKCKDFLKNIRVHCDQYRHCKPGCPQGNRCNKFHDKQHLDECYHPFLPPCPFTPFHCRFYNDFFQENKKSSSTFFDDHQHLRQFSHVCWYGSNCTDQTGEHIKYFIHIDRQSCSFGDKCERMKQEDHLNTYKHRNISDIRLLCKHGKRCTSQTDQSHNTRFRHSASPEDVDAIDCRNTNADINFVQNQRDTVESILKCLKSSLPSLARLPDDIMKWFRAVQPVYRCSQNMFELFVLQQKVMSEYYMKKSKEPEFVADLILQHDQIRRIEALRKSSVKEAVKQYIVVMVDEEYKCLSRKSVSSNQFMDVRREREEDLRRSISFQNITVIKDITRSMAKRTFDCDSSTNSKSFNQGKSIFSILGPHTRHKYGDIFIVFKREILHHPDSSFSIQSAESFHDDETYRRRSWLGPDPHSTEDRTQQYNKSKLHVSVPGYESAATLELVATVSQYLHKDGRSVNLDTVLREWPRMPGYKGIETNLPGLIPISYIDQVYIPDNIYHSLDQDTREIIDNTLRGRITTIPRKGTISAVSTTGQDFVNDRLNKQFSQQDEDSIARPLRGFIFTLSPSNFETHTLLPLTISQAFAQYRSDRTQSSRDNTTIIYWQAMGGDMMLTLSSDKDESDKNRTSSRSLICYLARTPDTNKDEYREEVSYLNSGSPSEHETRVSKGAYAAGSKTFYIGCNTDDFMTFCLKIQRSIGKITLSHAGPNSLYNNSTICFTFGKSELDLVALEFIRLSAGEYAVPIRNVMICFEEQADLHPKLDTNARNDLNVNNDPSASKPIKIRPKPNDPSSPSSSSSRHPNTPLTQTASSFSSSSVSSLIPCRDNVNCLLQLSNEKDHNSKYSHSCRFSELCRDRESNLTHEPHQVSKCNDGKNCKDLSDPFHRANYRHTGYPDYLIPCRDQQRCHDKTAEHRIRYSHGEPVFRTTSTATSRGTTSGGLTPCKHGSKCRDMNDQKHCQKYSHPKPTSSSNNPSFTTRTDDNDQCSICRTSLNSKEFDEITTSCGHTFHRECAQKRLDRYNKTDCQVCRQDRALGDALSRQKITPPETRRREQSPVPSARPNDRDNDNWSCRKCHKFNEISSKRCYSCGTYKDDRESSHSQSTFRNNEDHNNLTRDNRDFRTSLRPSSPPRTQSKEIVYVVNLPSDIKDDFDLTNLVRTRMENSLQIPIRDIKCYCKLGIGTIQVADRQTKNRLVQSIQEITLNVGGKSNTIEFVETLELTSFVVLEMNKDLSYPSTKEINVRWKDLYGGERPRSCEQFDRYFPNIYRLVTTSLDEILQIMHNSDFSVKKQNGRVYFCANCSFLTDLPTSTFEDEIRS
ncbi:unnamed protein product, partial [Adineta ricciae]